MNKITLLLLAGLLILPHAFAACGIPGDDSQLIFRISATTNAHAQLYNSAPAYPVEICYNTIFGVNYGLANPHNGNTILKASAATNAHVERADLLNYPFNINYGDLVCTYSPNCSGTEACVATISGMTNAHVATCTDPLAYATKVCCSSAAAVANNPPTANAGPDQSITSGDTVTLNGTCTDSDGTISNCNWGAAPAGCAYSGAQAKAGLGTANASSVVDVVCDGPIGSAFNFTVTATDDDSATGSDTMTTTISALPPVPTCSVISVESPIAPGDDSDIVVSYSDFVPVPGGPNEVIVCSNVEAAVSNTAVTCAGGTCTFTCQNYTAVSPPPHNLSVTLDDGSNPVLCTSALSITVSLTPSCSISNIAPNPGFIGDTIDVTVTYVNFSGGVAPTLIDCSQIDAAANGVNLGCAGGTCNIECSNYASAGNHDIAVTLSDGVDVVDCTGDTAQLASPPDVCSDGARTGSEECDIGSDLVPETADDDPCVNPAEVCQADCSCSLCGNGTVDAGEECDDGGNVSGDGCSATCLYEDCGDGDLDAGEACDPAGVACANPLDVCQADCSCVAPSQSIFRFIQFNVEPLGFKEPWAGNAFSKMDIDVLNSGDAGIATIKLELLNPEVDPPALLMTAEEKTCNIGIGAACEFDVGDFPGMTAAPGGLPIGVYMIKGSVSDASSVVHDEEFVVFNVGRPAPVPELDLALVLLIALSVIAVIFFSGREKVKE